MNWYRPDDSRVRRQPVDHIGTRAMAKVLGVTQERVRQLIRAGRIKAERIQLPEAERHWLDITNRRTGLGDYRVHLREWERFLRAHRTQQGADGA